MRLSNETRVEIFRMRLEGMTIRKIASIFHISADDVEDALLVRGRNVGKQKVIDRIAFPAIRDYMERTGTSMTKLIREVFGESCSTGRRYRECFYSGDLGILRKKNIDKLLDLLQLPYEEAFKVDEEGDENEPACDC